MLQRPHTLLEWLFILVFIIKLYYPRFQKPLSFHSLANEELKSLIDSHYIIGFDLFATLLLQPYIDRTDMFLHLELIEDCPGFGKERMEAETKIRKHQQEATIEDIYRHIPAKYRYLKEKELDLLYQISTVNDEIKQVLEYGKSRNKVILLLTDISLPESFMISLLKKHGLEECGFLCHEDNVLINTFLNTQQLTRRDLLFFGSNSGRYTELLKRSCLIEYINKPTRILRDDVRAKLLHKKHRDEVGASIMLALLSNINSQDDYWLRFGFKYGGPVILGFMKWLENQLTQEKINEVLFVARDGYTLEKIFNSIQNGGIKTHYIYAPRKMSIVINFDYKYPFNWGVDTLFSYFQNNSQIEHVEMLTRREYLQTHLSVYRKLTQRVLVDYRMYLDSLDLKEKRIGIVDTTSSNLSAQRAVTTTLLDKDIIGFYWFVSKNVQRVAASNMTVHTFQGSREWIFSNWDIMELLMRAPTPPIDSILNGTVFFKVPSEEEKELMRIYPTIMAGALEFSQQYLKYFGNIDIFFNAQILTDWINILYRRPTKEDKSYFRGIKQPLDPDHNHYQLLMTDWYRTYSSINTKILALLFIGCSILTPISIFVTLYCLRKLHISR